MSLALTILLSLLSAGILAGRVYEIINLTDANTGFLLVNGIVMNPYILGIFAVITLCCGILIFGSCRKAEPYYSASSKYTAFFTGAALVAAGVLSIQYEAIAPFFISGGLALIIMGITALGKKKTDIVVMILLLGFAMGMCMDVVSFDVSTYHNTVFMQNVLEYICMSAFMLTVVKNVYLPSKCSRMMLYVTGMFSFAVCSMMNIADIICYVLTGGQELYQIFVYAATALFGIFAFDTAVSSLPDKKEAEKNTAEEQIAETNDESEHSDKLDADETTETSELFAVNEIEKMLETVSEEKTEDKHIEGNIGMVDVPATEETDVTVSKYTMISELFGSETEKQIQAESRSILGETRSFKTVSQPKVDESAPQYDMLKGMFMGEDTSQYDFDTEETEKTVKKQPEKKKKHSLFGKNKKEKTVAENQQEEIPDTYENEKSVQRVKEQTAKKTKTDTQKIVYKKPK